MSKDRLPGRNSSPSLISLMESLENRLLQTTVTGHVFIDAGNTDLYATGLGLSGKIVYADLNNNHELDAGEPRAITDPVLMNCAWWLNTIGKSQHQPQVWTW